MMENTVKQRIMKFYKRLGLSQRAFERTCGLSIGYVNNISKGIGAEKMQMILNAFPQLSQQWLLTGEGNMLTTESDVTEQPIAEEGELVTTNTHGVSYYRVGGKLMARVPLMKFSAYGSSPDDWADLTADRDDVETIMVEVDRVSRGKYVVFSVDNDSMDDGTRTSFEAGDKIYVRELDRSDWMPRLRFETWPYWVVAFGNCIRLKQIIAQDDKGNITLHSLNPSPEFTDFTLQLDEVSHLYNVIRKIPKTIDFGK